ncbi:MAG: hypothetical protein CMJ31_10260 [Phycisphaerae bacterium]|nr:hypothetical protein [Phycisphaerae bacterium]
MNHRRPRVDSPPTPDAARRSRCACSQLLYVSRAASPISEDALLDIQSIARRNNRQLGITGLLLHSAGHFIQLLEGPATALAETFDRIERDPRHDKVRCSHFGPATGRLFPDWRMGVLDLAEVEYSGDIDAAVSLIASARDGQTNELAYERVIAAFEAFRSHVEAMGRGRETDATDGATTAA